MAASRRVQGLILTITIICSRVHRKELLPLVLIESLASVIHKQPGILLYTALNRPWRNSGEVFCKVMPCFGYQQIQKAAPTSKPDSNPQYTSKAYHSVAALLHPNAASLASAPACHDARATCLEDHSLCGWLSKLWSLFGSLL